MNPFQAIPETVRKWLYLAYGVAGLAPTATSAYYVAVGDAVPKWCVGMAAALGALTPLFGATAVANLRQRVRLSAKDVPHEVVVDGQKVAELVTERLPGPDQA